MSLPTKSDQTHARMLVAILFADVAGYSKLMHEDEDSALQLISRFETVFQEEVIQAGGQIVHQQGDGILCLFKSAVSAVQASLAMQLRFRNEIEVPVRIGIHTGDVIEREGDVYGDGVNIASRLENMGKPGTVLFSNSIYEKIVNHKTFEVASLGMIRLKNIRKPLEVYALANPGLEVPRSDELVTMVSQPVSGLGAKLMARLPAIALVVLTLLGLKLWNDASSRTQVVDKSIAVLPFRNDSGDDSNEYFCNGIMEDILIQLQKIGDLKVVSRTSVMPYKGSSKPIRTIASELDVEFILEGGIRIMDDQIRVTTQLTNGKDELQVWAGQFDDQLSAANLFEIQENIATNIIRELQAELSPEEEQIIHVRPTDNMEAYDNYLRGVYYYNNRFGEGEEFISRAVSMFENAIHHDSMFARAYLSLGYCHDHYYWMNFDGSKDRANLAKYNFEKALALDPNDPDIQEGQGWYEYHIVGDYKAAARIFEKISRNYPRLSSPYNALGVVNGRLGNWEIAETNFEQSIKLDPNYLVTYLNYYYNQVGQRKFARAKNYLDKVLNISPDNLTAHVEMSNLMILVNGDVQSAFSYFKNSGLSDPEHERRLMILSRSFDVMKQKEEEIMESDDYTLLLDYALINYYIKEVEKSKEFAKEALTIISPHLARSPMDLMALMQQAMLYALVGDREKAIKNCFLAAEARSIAKDALLGPIIELEHAKVQALLGDNDKCVDILTELMVIPCELTASLLKVDPIWDAVREDQAFVDLLAFYSEADSGGN